MSKKNATKRIKKNKRGSSLVLHTLPQEVLVSICSFLPTLDLLSISLCSKLFHSISCEDSFWQPIFLDKYHSNAKHTLAELLLLESPQLPDKSFSWKYKYLLFKTKLPDLFNKSSLTCLQLLEQDGVIDNDTLSDFLLATKSLSDRGIRFALRYYGVIVARDYARGMNYFGLNLVEALQRLFHIAPMPSESGQLRELLHKFSKKYTETSSLFNQNQIYGISIGLVMLNVDLHNPLVKTKLTKQTFTQTMKLSPIFLDEFEDEKALNVWWDKNGLQNIFSQFYEAIKNKSLAILDMIILENKLPTIVMAPTGPSKRKILYVMISTEKVFIYDSEKKKKCLGWFWLKGVPLRRIESVEKKETVVDLQIIGRRGSGGNGLSECLLRFKDIAMCECWEEMIVSLIQDVVSLQEK